MNVCIIGKNSYIGSHIASWLLRYGYQVFQLDVLSECWQSSDYSSYDVIIHVAGIVHRPDCQDEELYQKVNTDMPILIAKRYKESRKSVSTFVYLSTMAVYGTSKRLVKNLITEETMTTPTGLYGTSKLAADNGLLPLQSENFNVVVVRPPNVYGKNCKGGYISGFTSVIKTFPIIPLAYTNVKQSIIYIDNLCEFIHLIIEQKRKGVFMPQDEYPVSAVDICTMIAHGLGKKIYKSFILGLIVRLLNFIPLFKKAYGGIEYDIRLSHIEGMNYAIVPSEEAIIRTIK